MRSVELKETLQMLDWVDEKTKAKIVRAYKAGKSERLNASAMKKWDRYARPAVGYAYYYLAARDNDEFKIYCHIIVEVNKRCKPLSIAEAKAVWTDGKGRYKRTKKMTPYQVQMLLWENAWDMHPIECKDLGYLECRMYNFIDSAKEYSPPEDRYHDYRIYHGDAPYGKDETRPALVAVIVHPKNATPEDTINLEYLRSWNLLSNGTLGDKASDAVIAQGNYDTYTNVSMADFWDLYNKAGAMAKAKLLVEGTAVSISLDRSIYIDKHHDEIMQLPQDDRIKRIGEILNYSNEEFKLIEESENEQN